MTNSVASALLCALQDCAAILLCQLDIDIENGGSDFVFKAVIDMTFKSHRKVAHLDFWPEMDGG